MVDVMSAEKRSLLMGRIRTKDTVPELTIRKLLWRDGLRYRLHVKELPGKPDLVLPKWNAVVFVHGCFWHHHSGCSFFRIPATRQSFWEEKLRRNMERDASAIEALSSSGWRVAVVWECAIRADADRTAQRLAAWIRQGSRSIQLEAGERPIDGGVLVRDQSPKAH